MNELSKGSRVDVPAGRYRVTITSPTTGLIDAAAVLRARNLHEFDNLVTAPLHGFRDCDDYWRRASSKPLLASVAVPTLVLNPRNDPFMPAGHLPGSADVAPAVHTRGFVTSPDVTKAAHMGSAHTNTRVIRIGSSRLFMAVPPSMAHIFLSRACVP